MERAKAGPELETEFRVPCFTFKKKSLTLFDIDLWYQTFSVTIAEVEEEGNSDMEKTGPGCSGRQF